MSNILVTGGAGYIATHTIIELDAAGYTAIVIDNFTNSSRQSIERVEELIGKDILVYEGDVRDEALLEKIFSENNIEGVIHFAGLKAVGESVQKPIEYYDCNIGSTLTLLKAMKAADVATIVFSSSATVYGDPEKLPLTELSPVGINLTNPYGRTKYMIEEILRDTAASDSSWGVTILRYFNPIGAHKSGRIGEDPNGIPNNLLPFISQVAVGKRDKLMVFGDDYPTVDGTGVRDYIHVTDLARGHVAAIEHSKSGAHIYNIGTGHGTSVLELLRAFESENNITIPYEIVDRREGDVAIYYADASRAKSELGWQAKLTIGDAVRDAWNWQKNNPNGYEEVA